MPVILISGLPAGPTNLAGTELLEIQNGNGAGASQQTTVGAIVALALKSAVQSIQAGTSGMAINNTNPNSPIISVPVPQAGTNMSINNTNPAQPVINCTIPITGGIQAAYGTPGGSVLQTGNSVTGIATGGYNLTGWEIQCSPQGSITVDFLVGSLGQAPTSIIGTGGANGPQIASGTYNSASTLTNWASTQVPRGSVIEVKVTAVAAVEWFNVALLGTRYQ